MTSGNVACPVYHTTTTTRISFSRLIWNFPSSFAFDAGYKNSDAKRLFDPTSYLEIETAGAQAVVKYLDCARL